MSQDNRPNNRKKRQEWEIVEVAVKENAGVEVSRLPLQVPRFSFRVGTAHYPKEDDGPIVISSRLTSFNARDAIDLLADLDAKYNQIREDAIDDLEDRKRKAREAAARRANEPEVMVRRGSSDD